MGYWDDIVAEGATHASAIAGIAAMEDQHGILVDSLNALREQVHRGSRSVHLIQQIARLAEFTDLHFGCEESLLRRHGYPQLDQHRKAHQRLKDQIRLAVRRAENGQNAELDRTLASIRGQYLEHVEGPDREYSNWLHARDMA